MMDVLLFPVLLGALISVALCGVSRSRKRRPPFWPALCTALIVGVIAVFLAFGVSVFTRSFWTDNPIFDPAIAGVLLYVFGPFALASLIPALIVIALYRFQMGVTHDT